MGMVLSCGWFQTGSRELGVLWSCRGSEVQGGGDLVHQKREKGSIQLTAGYTEVVTRVAHSLLGRQGRG